jgi:hypothetical protein
VRGEPPRAYDVEQDIELPFEQRVGPLFDIFLDGVKVTKVTRFDADKGIVERYQTDESGLVILNKARDAACRETLHGKVETRWREKASA